MIELGELELYINEFNFIDKADLLKQLQNLFQKASDNITKNSLFIALSVLNCLGEQELLDYKEL